MIPINYEKEFKEQHGNEKPNDTRLFNQMKKQNPILSKEAKDKAYANMLKNLGVDFLGF